MPIIDQLGSLFGRSRSGDSHEAEPLPSTQPNRNDADLLQECPECEEVYLSEGPRECSTCKTTTTLIETEE